MNSQLSASGRKTWDGHRWMFVLFSIVFFLITFWLTFTGDFQDTAQLLLLVPASFCVGCLATAIFAKDELLQKIASLFMALG